MGWAMDASLLNGNLSNILNLIAAAGGLGTAAMGLVDAMKAFRGGPSNFGFKFIRAAVRRFSPPSAVISVTANSSVSSLRRAKASLDGADRSWDPAPWASA